MGFYRYSTRLLFAVKVLIPTKLTGRVLYGLLQQFSTVTLTRLLADKALLTVSLTVFKVVSGMHSCCVFIEFNVKEHLSVVGGVKRNVGVNGKDSSTMEFAGRALPTKKLTW